MENEAGVGFINQPITGKLELTKTDVADGKPLPNAGFRIKDEDGNIVATGVTDENGIATLYFAIWKIYLSRIQCTGRIRDR